MKKDIYIKKFFLVIYTFIFMYQVNLSYLIKINNFILFGTLTAVYIFIYICKYKRRIFRIFKLKYIILFICFEFLSVYYFMIRTLIAGTEMNLYSLRIIQGSIPVLYLIAAIIINNELNELEYNKEEKYKYIIKIALIQSAISIAMLINPSFKQVAKNIYYNMSTEENIHISQNRLYGICDGDYTYSLQIVHAIISLFTVFYAYKYNQKRYYFYAILIFMVTLLNGRAGIMIFGIGIIYLIIDQIVKTGKVYKVLMFIFSIGVITILLWNIIQKYIPSAYQLINHAINDIYSFNEGSNNTETGYLVSMLVFPEGEKIIYGEGYRIYAKKGLEYGEARSSDIGFVNELFMGGVIYAILLYYGYANLFFMAHKNNKKGSFERSCVSLLIITTILANIKGEFFRSQTLQINLMLMLVILTGKIKSKNILEKERE